MKNWKISLLELLLISTFCVSSCDKYNSKITGKVFYTNEDEKIDYPAESAVVTKLVQKNDSLRTIVAVVADANGEFLFDHNTKGTWILSGKFKKDSVTTYFGLSESFTTSGEDKVEVIIRLTSLIKEDTE
jgi:hypothetical protein